MNTVLCAMKSGLQGTRFAGASCVSPSYIFSAVRRKQSRSQLKFDQLFVCDRVFSHPLKPCERPLLEARMMMLCLKAVAGSLYLLYLQKKTSQNSDVISQLHTSKWHVF